MVAELWDGVLEDMVQLYDVLLLMKTRPVGGFSQVGVAVPFGGFF